MSQFISALAAIRRALVTIGIALSIVALGSESAMAATVKGLYRVTVPALEDAEDVEAEAFRMAFDRLLVRLTGNRGAPSEIGLMALAEDARRFVRQYGYANDEEILVVFDGPAVESELVRLGASVWSAERPATLAWVVLEQGRGRRSVIAQVDENGPGMESQPTTETQVRDLVLQAAEDRGLPIVLPVWDDIDQSNLSVEDIWGGFNDKIEAASARYGADAVLVGRVRSSNGAFAVRWSFITGDDYRERRGSVRDGIHWLADTYAAQFAVSGGASRQRLTVMDLESFEDYGRVMSFLEQLSLVQSITVEALDGNTMTLLMEMRGSGRALERALSLGNVLQPVPAPLGPGPGSGDLYFRVTGN